MEPIRINTYLLNELKSGSKVAEASPKIYMAFSEHTKKECTAQNLKKFLKMQHNKEDKVD